MTDTVPWVLPCTADTSGVLDIVTTTTPGSGEGLAAVGFTFDPSIRMWTQVPYSVRRGLIRATANTGKCIHKEQVGFANGNPIHLWNCDSVAPEAVENQTWIYEERTGFIRNARRPDKCIQRQNNNLDSGNRMELEDCDADNVERRTGLFE